MEKDLLAEKEALEKKTMVYLIERVLDKYP